MDRAADHIRKTLTVYPAHGRAHYELALVLADRGDQEGALQHLERALYEWEEADAEFRLAQQARAKYDELKGARGGR